MKEDSWNQSTNQSYKNIKEYATVHLLVFYARGIFVVFAAAAAIN